MTDEKYLFEQTSRERKRTARGAYAKKGGSRSKRCSLPSDYLTAKQRKELNGAVETINTMKMLAFDEWARLSTSMQKAYLEILFNVHQARAQDIAELWGKRPEGLRRLMERRGIEFAAMAKKSRAFKMKKADKAWLRFLEGSAEKEEPKVQEPVDDNKVTQGPSDVVKQADDDVASADELVKVISGTLNYIGDPAAVFQKVMLALDPSKRYHIQVRYQVYEEKEVSNDD